jgi:hypothetical protein
MKNLFVLEWSPTQQCFHIQPLADAVESNRRRFYYKPWDMFDWVPVHVGTQEECLERAEDGLGQMKEEEAWTH